MPDSPPYDFFVSYTGADICWAEWIASTLEAHNRSTTLAAWDFRAGGDFVTLMSQALAGSKSMLALFTPRYLNSRWTELERNAALVKDKLIPILLEPCDIPDIFSSKIYIDLTGKSEEEARNALLQGVREVAVDRAAPRPFPATSAVGRFPGVLPATWNMGPRNPRFTGRDAMLAQVHSAFTSGRRAARIQAIAGLGGCGKTNLAVEYAYRYARDYSKVWWMSSGEPTSLAIQYGSLGKELSPEQGGIDGVRNWLAHNRDWLLIFDDAPRPEELERYLPGSETGRILITSRYPNWRAIAEVTALEGFSREESVAMILEQSGRDEPEAAAALAERLGDFPLALQQVASFVVKEGVTLQDYVGYLEHYPLSNVLEGLAATWQISLDKLFTERPESLRILNLMAFLGAENIPRDLLLPAGADALALNRWIEGLLRYSLVQSREGLVGVHRLVQEITRDRLPAAEKKTLVEAVVARCADANFDSQNPMSWPKYAKVFPHALAAARHAEELGVGLTQLVPIYRSASLYAEACSQFEGAEQFVGRALLAEQKIRSDPATPQQIGLVAALAARLSQIALKRGDAEQAVKHAESAMRLGEKAWDSEDLNMAGLADVMAMALQERGEWDRALTYALRSFDLYKEKCGMNSIETARAANNLGTISFHRKDFEGARKFFQEAASIAMKNQWSSPEAVTFCRNLGSILRVQGEFVEALIFLQSALDYTEKLYGPNDAHVATSLNEVGLTQADQKAFQPAICSFERALAIAMARLGPEHPTTGIIQKNLNWVRSQIPSKPLVP